MIVPVAPATTYLCHELAGIYMSPDEFDAVDDGDDNYRYELIRGVLVVSPVASEAERGPNDYLGYLLLQFRESVGGQVLEETLPEQYVRTAWGRRRPDRVIWAGLGRRPKPQVDVPTIIAEFVSKRRRDVVRDYQDKRQEYLAIGVAEYWVIDRFRRTLTVFCRDPADPAGFTTLVVGENDNFTTALLPGFVLPLGQLFAAADRWASEE